MTRKQRRGTLIVTGVVILTIAGLLVLSALRNTIVFFHMPSAVAEGKVKSGQRFRLGGLVQNGSVKRDAGASVEFVVTDKTSTIPVTFRGILPDLFREGQGVIAEGRLNAQGVFVAETVLAKHDENYMPPEVAKALKEQGMWQHGEKSNKSLDGTK